MGCLSEDLVLALAQGQLATEKLRDAEQHVSQCRDCRQLVAEAMRYGGQDEGEGPHPDRSPPRERGPTASPRAPGTRVGRFEIEGVLGAGASGIVYRAYDPQLDRRVALKLLRPDIGGPTEAADWRRRMVLEAQAMARLTHPNVVVVYDGGLLGDEVFIAMEIVEGESLASWLRRRPRNPTEIVGIFFPIAHGLAAAHAAGVVHGDFKPANVLVGDDGRPRIADFGLAHRVTQARPEAGRSAGTPLYMAPEQMLGQGAQAASDQFGYCVALFEALYGRHPFGDFAKATPSLLELSSAVIRGDLRVPSAGSAVPHELFEVLRRGLSARVELRFASMTALAEALERAVGRSLARAGRRRAGRAAVVAGAVAAAAAGLWQLSYGPRCGDGRRDRDEECDDANANTADACLPDCRIARCGDGHVRPGVEECDDGNLEDTDACNRACLRCATDGAASAWAESGRCYALHAQPLTWSLARATCLRSRGDLASIGEGREIEATRAHLRDGKAAAVWIGLRTARPGGRFLWLDGNGFRKSPGLNRSSQDPAGDCAALSLQGGNLSWAATSCEDQAGFLCERGGWVVRPSDGRAYALLLDPVPWRTAVARCRSLGARLVEIEDASEHAFVTGQTRTTFWIGAGDHRREGAFEWLSGRPLVFQRFAPGEPDSLIGDNDCVAVGPEGLWHDRPCTPDYAFMCERD